eukprot:1005183_1
MLNAINPAMHSCTLRIFMNKTDIAANLPNLIFAICHVTVFRFTEQNSKLVFEDISNPDSKVTESMSGSRNASFWITPDSLGSNRDIVPGSLCQVSFRNRNVLYGAANAYKTGRVHICPKV